MILKKYTSNNICKQWRRNKTKCFDTNSVLDCIKSLFRLYIYIFINYRINFESDTKEAHTFCDLRNTSYLCYGWSKVCNIFWKMF